MELVPGIGLLPSICTGISFGMPLNICFWLFAGLIFDSKISYTE